MNMFALLTGIIIAAALFAALLWSIYRAVIVKGHLRLNNALLAISTILIVASITWNFPSLTITSGLTCLVTAAIAIWHEQRWSKLLPMVQALVAVLSMGGAFYVLT